jgi:hypothetical protein
MDKGSPEATSGDPRGYWLSGQTPCRTAMGAACRGVPVISRRAGLLFFDSMNEAGAASVNLKQTEVGAGLPAK